MSKSTMSSTTASSCRIPEHGKSCNPTLTELLSWDDGMDPSFNAPKSMHIHVGRTIAPMFSMQNNLGHREMIPQTQTTRDIEIVVDEACLHRR